ncbi:PAS domain S-box protein [Phenylobacterium sp. RIFCSPHIGHO2_01_FULL_69_31]|uniref:PAS domain S-box protein n=1 Tax=Phenylobacterium sp. RIFCSPHIGHO2_01_FULL_69_31 TaxID=1801944 RepID=UPI000AFC63B6|nr:PAS domain S-box protein [Phenylobacterium sp. RIFCSPHIGHO2_01_FULL_69_31]
MNQTSAADFGATFWRTGARTAEAATNLTAGDLDGQTFRLLADNLPTLCWVANGDGYIVWYNRRWHEYCGTTPAEMEGWGWQSVHDPAVLPEVLEAWQRSIASGEPFEMVFPLRGADGVFRPFLTRVCPLQDDAGRVIRWFGVNTEISRQMQAEAAFRESEARFRNMADHAPVMMWVTDADGACVYLNRSWYEFTGQTEAEALGLGWLKAVHPDDEAESGRIFLEANARREPFRLEYRLRRADGSYRLAIDAAAPRFDSDGAFLGYIGSVIDIEDRREHEQALRETEERLRLATEAAEVGFWDVDVVNDVLIWPPIVKAMFGISPDAPVSMQDFYEGLHPDDRESTAAAFAAACDPLERALYDVEYRTVGREDGQVRWVAAKGRGIFDAQGRCVRVIGAAIDITARKKADAELRELNENLERRVAEEVAEREQVSEALRQAQKMETVGQLTGGIGHDFNNMLAVVMGSLDLLKRRLPPTDARAVRYLDAAVEGAQRAATLTQRLLAFSRQQPLRPEPLDTNKLVGGMSEFLHHSLGGSVRLETVLAAGVWRIEADRNQLESAILNLAVNARDAMPERGRLTIETQNCHLDERYVAQHIGVPPGQYVMIAVTDTGVGMSAETAAKAFDPFFTTKSVGKGTGLGLSQVYGFVKQSGGHVKIYSEVGQGTTVKIYLPRSMASGTEVESGPPDTAALQGDERELILVVEDEPAVRQFSVDALIELGYRVLSADGAEQALRLIDSNPEITLLFTDVVMPEVNGRKLADEALRRRPELKVLFTTGYTRNAVVHNGVLDPGVELIGKPFTVDQLAAKVRAILDA